MREHTTTAERILDALARVPSRPHDEARALSLVRSNRNTALLAAAGRPDGEAREVVEDYRRVLLGLLVEVTGPPACPKCGGPMTGGAPHGPWPVQWECSRCGTVVVPPRNAEPAPVVRCDLADCPGCGMSAVAVRPPPAPVRPCPWCGSLEPPRCPQCGGTDCRCGWSPKCPECGWKACEDPGPVAPGRGGKGGAL